MAETLKTEWTFKGTIYGFSYPVSRAWAKAYLRDREGLDV